MYVHLAFRTIRRKIRRKNSLKKFVEKNSSKKPQENVSCDLCDGGQNLPPPPGRDRVKVSENLGATSVAPVDTSL